MNRNIDNSGRIVIPKEIRKKLNIHSKDKIAIEVKGTKIILSKVLDRKEEIEKEIIRLQKLLED